jgi:hypothetical protein
MQFILDKNSLLTSVMLQTKLFFYNIIKKFKDVKMLRIWCIMGETFLKYYDGDILDDIFFKIYIY